MSNLQAKDPLAVKVVKAIHSGEIEALQRLLVENPGLATTRIVDAKGATCTLLHKAADWPGHFPNRARSVAIIAAAGGDASAPIMFLDSAKRDETPLHWAASSDDVEVLDALLDAGADIEAPGACIAGGTALDDAIAFGQWRAARRLVERGARTAVWHSSSLGLMDRVEAYFAGPKSPPLYPWGAVKAHLSTRSRSPFGARAMGGSALQPSISLTEAPSLTGSLSGMISRRLMLLNELRPRS